MSSQGHFEAIVLPHEAQAWFSEKERLILEMLGGDTETDQSRNISFERHTLRSCDEKEIPDGYVLALIEFSQD